MRDIRTARRAGPPLEIGYASVMTPLGPIWMAGSTEGIVKISLSGRSERSFLSSLAALLGHLDARARPDGAGLKILGRQLLQYFQGERREFTLPVDLLTLTPFQHRVLEETSRVPFGRVVPYGEIARSMRVPGAARAVGNALGRNPVPILIPCHRVVASDGTIGGFTGGTRLKRKLLAVEGLHL